MKIELIETAGFASAFEALRLPFGKESRGKYESDIKMYVGNEDTEFRNIISTKMQVGINGKDIELAKKLIKSGDCEAKVLRGINVWLKITAPVYWWCEEETYRAGHERLCSESTMHIDCKGLAGEELQKAKAEIPMGKELTKIDMFSYQCLRNIYIWRKHHRLPEWREFCAFIESLPLASELITYGLCEEKDQNTETTK